MVKRCYEKVEFPVWEVLEVFVEVVVLLDGSRRYNMVVEGSGVPIQIREACSR